MKVLVIGSNGKMGTKMMSILRANGHTCFGIDANNRDYAEDIQFDIVVDFSSPDALKDNIKLSVAKNRPIVIGTTGHDAENMKIIKRASKKIGIFLSSNFSLAFNLLLKFVSQMQALQGYDFVVEETHHKHKKDAPSGSCKEILERLQAQGINAQVAAFRAGEIVGKHSVTAYGKNEILILSHEALSRDVFCEGAIKACEFMLGKGNGLYSMSDLLGEI